MISPSLLLAVLTVCQGLVEGASARPAVETVKGFQHPDHHLQGFVLAHVHVTHTIAGMLQLSAQPADMWSVSVVA